MKADEFDRRFDAGEDMGPYLDWGRAVRPNLRRNRNSVALPEALLDRVDVEAGALGITRERLIERWIVERLG